MADGQPFVNLPGGEELFSGQKAASGKALLRMHARPRGAGQWFLVVSVVTCILVNKAMVLLTPLTWRYAVSALSEESPQANTAIKWTLAYCLLAIIADAMVQLRGALWGRLSNQITRQVSLQLFTHLHALSLRWHLNRKTGDVLRIIDVGVKAVVTLISVLAFNMGPTILEVILVSCIFFQIGVPAISLCVMAAAFLYTGYTIFVTRKRAALRKEVNNAQRAMQDKTVDSLLNFETVKLFAAEEAEAAGYGAAAGVYAKAQVKAQDSLSVLNWGQTVSMQLGMASGLLIACLKASTAEMSVGEFVMIQMYIIQIFKPLIMLGGNYNSVIQAMVDLETMTDLLAIPPEIVEKPNARDLGEILERIPREQRTVEFDNVTFFYDPGQPGGVKNLNFVIRTGDSVALVGPSGSGKSTSTRLLCRLMEVTSGGVRISNVDVRDVTQASLRRCVSVVSQDTVLFNSSIRYNLSYGKPGATEAELQEACRLAQVTGYLNRMEKGLETAVGERGLRLSGGEKQRLGIARALLTNPSVLVLDEATSALDTNTEREVQEAIEGAAAGRCTLAIAHRLSTVVNVTEIIVLRSGEVVERGSHADLVRSGGLFAEMWAAQADAAGSTVEECKVAVEYACNCKKKGCCPSK